MKILRISAMCMIIGVTGVQPLLAHHGYAQYDFTSSITVKGKVISWELINPHSLLTFEVKGSNGKIQHWVVEQAAPSMMMRSPTWNAKTLQPGDEIEVVGHPAKNGSFSLRPMRLTRLRDGKILQDSIGKASQPGYCLDGVTFDENGLPHPCTEPSDAQ